MSIKNRTITLRQIKLAGACPERCKEFKKTFGTSVVLTEAIIRKHYENWPAELILQYLLSKKQHLAYLGIENKSHDKLQKKLQALNKEYLPWPQRIPKAGNLERQFMSVFAREDLPDLARAVEEAMQHGKKEIAVQPIMKFFEYSHLPEHLQAVSKPIGDLAIQMDKTLPDCAEKSAGLRKLLEAKDCLVRAALP